MSQISAGTRIRVPYQEHEIEAVIIDPDGFGKEKPTIGVEFFLLQKYIGIPLSTLSDWIVKTSNGKVLKLPSGKTFEVVDLDGNDGRTANLIEVKDWVEIAVDLGQAVQTLRNPRQNLVSNVIKFLVWFNAKEFYTQAYKIIKCVFSEKQTRSIQLWKEERALGIPPRKEYTSYICKKDSKYGKWTNIIYQGLFGMNAAKMRHIWSTQAGSSQIARNHIPEAIGLKAVAYCERLISLLSLDDIKDAHVEAIRLTRKKFKLDCPKQVA